MQTLEQAPTQPSYQTETDDTLKRNLDYYHDLNMVELGSIVNVPLTSRVEAEGANPSPDSSELNERPGFGTESDYQTVVDVARIGQDEASERVYGPMTDERIGRDILLVARNFRVSHITGVLEAYKVSEKYRPSYKTEREDAPYNIVREPIPIIEADTSVLKEAPETDRIAILSEIMDPYRYRHDIDAPPSTINALQEEQKVAIELLESLEPSWQKDLVAVNAYKYFIHKFSSNPDFAERALDVISVPELQKALLASSELAKTSSPDKIIEQVGSEAEGNLTKILNLSEIELKKLKDEALERSSDFAVTINISETELLKTLFDTNQVLPVSEVKRSGGNPTERGLGRTKAEDQAGIHPELEALLDRPIYGALALSPKEKILGASGAQGYGNSVIVLKPEVANGRAIYSFGDSMDLRNQYGSKDNFTNERLNLPCAAVAKLALDKGLSRRSGNVSYVESQVYGVTAEDIASITVPINGVPEAGVITRIREQYPSIELNVRMTPKKDSELTQEDREYLEGLGVNIVVV